MVGGGLSGTCAAIASARCGARTALVHDRPMLGGNSASEVGLVPEFGSTHTPLAKETGIIEELYADDRRGNHALWAEGLTNSLWDLTIYDAAVSEPNLTLLLNASVRRATVDDAGGVASVWAVEWGTERDFDIEGRLFVDATGTGTLGFLAGADYVYGREGRAAFGEPLQPEEPDELVMGNTMYYRASDLGRPTAFEPPAWSPHYRSDAELGSWRFHPWPHCGHHWLELGYPDNPIEQGEELRRSLIAEVVGFWDHMKNHCDGKARNYALDWIGGATYRRESRRLLGDYVLTQHDIQGARRFDDGVCFGVWPIDMHPPGGLRRYHDDEIDASQPQAAWPPEVREMALKFIEGMRPYAIPFRCLYSRNVPNLLSAGRNISTSYVAFCSSRILPTGALTGEAAGTAAALCARHELTPRGLLEQRLDELQQLLLRNDVFIPGVANSDPADLARRATATASSESVFALPEEPAAAVALQSELAQIVPVTASRIDSVEALLRTTGGSVERVALTVRPAASVWDADVDAPVAATAEAVLDARDFDWVEFTFAADVEPGYYLFELSRNPNVEAAISFQATDSGCCRAVLAESTAAGIPLAEALEQLTVAPTRIPPGTVAMRRLGFAASASYGGLPWSYHVQPPTVGHFAGVFESLVLRLSPRSHPYGAANVLSGVARPDGATNIWISDPAQPLPQTLTLRFAAATELDCVRLTFDTNLSRLPEYPFYVAPECVRDYELAVRQGAEWTTVAKVEGNHQRLRVHRFAPVRTEELRLTVSATNGSPSARVYEIRAYREGGRRAC